MELSDMKNFIEKEIVKLDENTLEITLETKFKQTRAGLEQMKLKLQNQIILLNSNITKIDLLLEKLK